MFTKGCPKDLYTCKESGVGTTTAGDMAHVIKDSHMMTNLTLGLEPVSGKSMPVTF